MRKGTILSVLIILTLFSSCRNRLQPQLYYLEQDSRVKLTKSDCYYVEGMQLSNSPDSMDMISGAGNLLITNQDFYDSSQVYFPGAILSVDRKLTYRIFINLPAQLSHDSLDIADHSVCRIIGLYELDDAIKMYHCREGYLLIDSVRRSSFYGDLSAVYFNNQGDSLKFTGDMKVRRKE
jgi:hypothetical protein